MKDVMIMAIESSCDETAVAIVKNGREILANIISSQIDLHKLYGGVVPEIASRKHIENIDTVLDEALATAKITLSDIDALAVTCGPGLVGALLVGVSYAKSLAFALNKPLIAVNHIEGHIFANFLENKNFEPPFVCLVVSGGHTHLIHVTDYDEFEIMGKTFDDAAGEAFDKIARALDLGYPGGPKIDEISKKGDSDFVKLPRVMLDANKYDFSFSGLKSSVLNYLNKSAMMGETIVKESVAASFQKAVVDVLVAKTIKACQEKNIRHLALAGGVSCNSFLRTEMQLACENNNIQLNIPAPIYCTDNAAMIASRAYYSFIKNEFSDSTLNAYPNLKLSTKK